MSAAEWVLIAVAAITASVGLINARYGRMGRVEARLAAVESLNHRMWVYVRKQHDHAYRSGYQPLPIPDDLFGEPETK